MTSEHPADIVLLCSIISFKMQLYRKHTVYYFCKHYVHVCDIISSLFIVVIDILYNGRSCLLAPVLTYSPLLSSYCTITPDFYSAKLQTHGIQKHSALILCL